MAKTSYSTHPLSRGEVLAGFQKLRERALSGACDLDAFLSSIAAQYPSHAFLGKATQGGYLRQISLLSELAELIFQKPFSKMKVLDWGCGKGHISYLLKKRGFRVTSCDRKDSSDDSSFGQETPILKAKGIRIVPLDHEVQLPFADKSFEVVTGFGVLEHVPKDADSMREIARVLKPGGIFFVCFLPYFLSWTQLIARLRGNDYHDRLYSARKLQRLASQAGLTVVDVWHGQFFPKNSLAHSSRFEKWDRFLTSHTPLQYLSTNLEAVLVRPI